MMKKVLTFIECLMGIGVIYLTLEALHVEDKWLRLALALSMLFVFFFVHMAIVVYLARKEQKEPKKAVEETCTMPQSNKLFYLLCALSLIACTVLFVVGLCDMNTSVTLLLFLLSVIYLGGSIERMIRHD